jgi:hypothetical protein
MANTIIVHLPSNSPDYPENTSNKYRVHLGRTLHFPGEWVCGLHSIIYPYTWPSISTLDEQFIRIHYDEGKILHLQVRKSSVDNIDHLVDFLGATLNEHKKKLNEIFDRSEPPMKRRKRENSVTPPPDSPIIDRTPPPDSPDVTPSPDLSDSEEKTNEKIPHESNSTLIQSTPQPSVTPQSSIQTPVQSSMNAPSTPGLNSSKANSDQDTRKEETKGVDFQETIAGSEKIEVETPKDDQKEKTEEKEEMTDIGKKQKKEQQPQESNSSNQPPTQSTNQTSIQPPANQNLAPLDSSNLNSSETKSDQNTTKKAEENSKGVHFQEAFSGSDTPKGDRKGDEEEEKTDTDVDFQETITGSKTDQDDGRKEDGGTDFQEAIAGLNEPKPKQDDQIEKTNNGIKETGGSKVLNGSEDNRTSVKPEKKEENREREDVDFVETFTEENSDENEEDMEGVDFIETIAGPIGTLLSDFLSGPDDELEPYLTKMFGSIQEYVDYERVKKILDSVTFFYHPRFDRFVLYLNDPKISHIELSEQLAYILGFEYRQDIRHNEFAKYGVDLKGGFTSFAVYANGLTANMIIGNSINSLLRIVSIGGAKQGENVEKIYDSPLYCQVLPKEVDEIEIEIKTMDNRLVPFQYGNVMIVLIFKKVINF